ncbi:MAG: amidohydrolase family protein [Thermoplasmata archaeon]|nr:amidohydrolase family protein [Thermoplasmata archaeon]
MPRRGPEPASGSSKGERRAPARSRHATRSTDPGPRTHPRRPTTGEGRFDFHLHLSQYWPEPLVNRYDLDLELSVHSLLREMDANGIADGLLLQLQTAPDVEATLAEADRMYRESGGRLWHTSTVDPTRGVEEVARAVGLWEQNPSLRAIKLYPGYRRFYPHDVRLEPVYRFAAEHRIPVLFHQGDTLDPLGMIKYARPIELDEVAVEHRNVRFVLCHLGNPWVEEAAEVVYKNENVYTDTSGLVWSPRMPHFDRQVQRATRRMENAFAAMGTVDRVLYGSDWPLESLSLATGMIEALDFSAAEKAQILGGNARRLLARRP